MSFKVYVALGFHINFYHSWRGDTPAEAGFGTDMRVIREVLKILERSHQAGLKARAYWDTEVYWTFQEILGAATVARTRAYSVLTQDVRLAGAATAIFANTFEYTAQTQDVRLAGTAPAARTRAYSALTQDVLLAGAATTTRLKVPTVVASDELLAGSATAARHKVATVVTEDVMLAGHGTSSFNGVTSYEYNVITKDLLVQGASSQSKHRVATVVTSDLRLGGTVGESFGTSTTSRRKTLGFPAPRRRPGRSPRASRLPMSVYRAPLQ